MRILVLSYEFPPIGGGGSRVVNGLCRELVRLDHTVDLVTMGFDDLPREEVIEGVNVNRVPCIRLKKHHCTAPEAATYMVAALPVARRLLRERSPDLVHSHFIFPDGLIAWLATRKPGIPYLITAHGSDVPGYNPHRLKLAHRVLAPLWRVITENSAQVICPSEVLQHLVQRQGARARVSVIPNGIDPSKFHNQQKEKRILIVTRMLQRKGIQYLLQALQELTLDHEVHIVGDGPYLPTLKKIAQGVGVPVKFWGWLENDSPELRELYETSSIYVLPSESENFPIGLLEAMAARMAIITTRGTGCEEVVGDSGVLVAPKDLNEIREAIQQLTADVDRCRDLGQKARQRLEENFSWQAVAKRYTGLYGQHLRHLQTVRANV